MTKRAMSVLMILALLAVQVVGNVTPAHAETCTVTSGADSGAGSLRALLADTACSTIDFDGDYTINLASTLSIERDATIDGTGHAVTISGDTDGDGTGTVQVFTIASGATVTLQDLTVADGYILGSGGGIHNSGSLTVANVTFTSNMAAGSTEGGYYGGAVFNQGSLTVTESVFSANRAGGTAQGGAIANGSGGVVTVSGSTFDNNQGDMGGGALFNEGELTIDGCAFTGNIGIFFGGGAIWNLSDNLVVINSVFSDNTASGTTGYPAYGGAILNFGTMSAEGNTFDGNSATGWGGAVAGITHPGYPSLNKANSLTNNTFRGNSATDSGGAVHAAAYGDGNAITLNLTNNTFAENSAPTGGNLYFGQTTFGTLTAELDNNILVRGATGDNCVFYGDSSTPTASASHNLADDNTCGTGFTLSGSILLGELSDNGGPTQTIPLLTGSEAIDTGDDAVCPDTDQRGVSRPQDGDGDGTAVCDIGAYEQYEPSAEVVYATEDWGHSDVTNPENALGEPDDMVADLSVSGSNLHLGFSQPICISLTIYGTGTIFLMSYSPDYSTTPLYIEEAVLNGSTSFEFDGKSDYVVIRNALGGTVTIDALEGIACTGTENNPPIAVPGGTYYGEVDTPVSFDGSGSSDPDGDELTYAWTFGDGGTGSGVNPSHSYAAAGTYNVCLTVNDGSLDSQAICTSANVSDAPSNTAPVADHGGPYTGEVGVVISFDGSGSSDPDGDALTYAWDFGDGETGDGVNPAHAYTAAGTYDVCLTVNDGTVNSAPVCTTAQVTAPNAAPVADPGGPYLVAVGGSIVFDGSGSSDPDGDALTETWTADGGTVSGSTYIAGSEAGIFEVCLMVSDGSLASEPACTLAVVYDPSAGFVTGSGWIDSPAGAYKWDESLSGKATFAFVSKYKKGASVPEGNTEFQFQAGGFNFHSDMYEWLVVNQDGTNAQFKGSGTVNGQLDPNGEAYKFMIWATDGDPDTFHIRIWWEGEDGVEHDVYDNGVEQAIGGGSIVVHAK